MSMRKVEGRGHRPRIGTRHRRTNEIRMVESISGRQTLRRIKLEKLFKKVDGYVDENETTGHRRGPYLAVTLWAELAASSSGDSEDIA